MVRALFLEDPNNANSLTLNQLALPDPAPGEVRLRFTSIGLNRADLLYCQNRYFSKPPANSRLGFEGAGIIEAKGPGVSFNIGDRVATCPMSIDAATQGCLADQGIYQASQLLPSPSNVSDIQTGSIWMAYLTAWGGMIDCGKLLAGQHVVITAASSSVGLAAIHLAKEMGAIPIATTTSPEKVEALKELGAGQVIIQPREADEFDHFANEIMDITQGKGCDLCFDAVAGPASRALIKASKRGARIVIHGLLDRRPMDVHAGVLMKRLLTLKGYTLDETLNNPSLKQGATRKLTQLFDQGKLKPNIAKTFRLEQYKEAFDYLALNQHIGKIVVLP